MNRTYQATLCIPTSALPVGVLRKLNAEFPEDPPLGPNDTADDMECEVHYKPGWYKPGRLSGPPDKCYPDEGEAPEVLSVLLLDHKDEKGKPIDIIGGLSESFIRGLEDRSWSHEDDDAYDYGPEPDDYEPYYPDDWR